MYLLIHCNCIFQFCQSSRLRWSCHHTWASWIHICLSRSLASKCLDCHCNATVFIHLSYDGLYYGMGWACLLSVRCPFVVRPVNLYLVNTITDPASPNLVCGFFMGRSRMSSYLGHLDLFSRSPRSTLYRLVNAITCEIIDSASPTCEIIYSASSNSVFGFFMGRSRMS